MNWPTWIYRLNDTRDSWKGNDKEAHFFGGAFVYMLAAAHTAHPVAFVVLAILAVEAIEAVLWQSLTAERRNRIVMGVDPWPFMHDRASLKDIIAGAIGAAFAALVG